MLGPLIVHTSKDYQRIEESVEECDNMVVEIKNKWMKFKGRGEMLSNIWKVVSSK